MSKYGKCGCGWDLNANGNCFNPNCWNSNDKRHYHPAPEATANTNKDWGTT